MKNKHRTCENCVHLIKYKEGNHTIRKRTDKNKHYFVCQASDERMDSPHERCDDWQAIPYSRTNAKRELRETIDEFEQDQEDDLQEMLEYEAQLDYEWYMMMAADCYE